MENKDNKINVISSTGKVHRAMRHHIFKDLTIPLCHCYGIRLHDRNATITNTPVTCKTCIRIMDKYENK